MGARVAQDCQTLTVFLPTEQSGRTLPNLAETGEITICFVSMRDYRAVQVKGKLIAVRECDADDELHVLRYRRAFVESCVAVGLAREVVERMVWWPSTAVDLSVRELYSQ